MSQILAVSSFITETWKNPNGAYYLSSSLVEKIDVVRRGKARRAKLFYLRKLTGKKAKLKEIQK